MPEWSWRQPGWGWPSCRPCCSGLLGEEHGCGGLRGSGHYRENCQRFWAIVGMDVRPRFIWSAWHTERSSREWHRRHSTAASGTSWERCILGIQMRPRYPLWDVLARWSFKCDLDLSRLFHLKIHHRHSYFGVRGRTNSCGFDCKRSVSLNLLPTYFPQELIPMFLIVNLLMALSFGVQREQLLHLIGLTWPLPVVLLDQGSQASGLPGLNESYPSCYGRWMRAS